MTLKSKFYPEAEIIPDSGRQGPLGYTAPLVCNKRCALEALTYVRVHPYINIIKPRTVDPIHGHNQAPYTARISYIAITKPRTQPDQHTSHTYPSSEGSE